MAIGGVLSDVQKDVEVLDLMDSSRSCQKPDDYPGADVGMVGTYINDQVLVCGGYSFKTEKSTEKCYKLTSADGNWEKATSMNEYRSGAEAVLVSDVEWWVTGAGADGKSMEKFSVENDSFSYLEAKFSESMAIHNFIRVNDSLLVLFGGYAESDETFFYNVNESSWSNGPELLEETRFLFGGLYTFSNGTSVVVAAGGEPETNITEVLNLDKGFWQPGPLLPKELCLGHSLQGANTFFVVGGVEDDKESVSIYELNLEEDRWIPRTSLSNGKSGLGAFHVPDEYCIED